MGAPHCDLNGAATRAERFAAVHASYPNGNENELGTIDHVMLVEESLSSGDGGSGAYYVTLHPSAEAAADYHDTQEYTADKAIRELVDLDTGNQFFAVPHTTFERFPD